MLGFPRGMMKRITRLLVQSAWLTTCFPRQVPGGRDRTQAGSPCPSLAGPDVGVVNGGCCPDTCSPVENEGTSRVSPQAFRKL